MANLEEFRKETRDWIETNCPIGVRGSGPVPWGSTKLKLDDASREWLERMAVAVGPFHHGPQSTVERGYPLTSTKSSSTN
ncbi:MAG: hypothetical protein CM1200mP9_12340 [Gammaproteobacteria bacterium]|nr:MAG: hypothetical protein CM1200mP9_12340 [Gammaproteobacteria bacterium]